jgi:hypothetical protein
MLRLLALLLIVTQTYAQPNVWISGHLTDGANEEVTVTVPRFGRSKDDIVLANTKADKNGLFGISFKIEHGQPITLSYLNSHFFALFAPQR